MQVKKSPKVDLERKKFIFLQIGFVLALTICLVAFEWTTEEVGMGVLGDLDMEEIWEEEIESTFHEEEEIPEPEPEPEPEIEEVFEELLVVDDDEEVESFFDFDAEADERTATDFDMSGFEEEEEEELEPIDFAVVEEKPEFPGGDAALMQFIAQNTKYPPIAMENGIQGRVFVQFVIDENGKVTNVRIARGVDPYLDQEALRVVKLIPDWTPGRQRGQAVPVNYIIPINFRLY